MSVKVLAARGGDDIVETATLTRPALSAAVRPTGE
jgi:hypothetical protein